MNLRKPWSLRPRCLGGCTQRGGHPGPGTQTTLLYRTQVPRALTRFQQQSQVHHHLQCCHQVSPPHFSLPAPPKPGAAKEQSPREPQNKSEQLEEGSAVYPMDQARKRTARQPSPASGRGHVPIGSWTPGGGTWEAARNVLEVLESS